VGDLDRSQPLPYYYQLKRILLDLIDSREWDDTTPLPTERELQERYQVSRSVVRQALNELVHEGYVVRQQGRGTFALPRKVRHNPQPDRVMTNGLSGFLKVHGMTSSTRLLSREVHAPDAVAAASLELSENDKVLRFERLRLADGVPIGLHTVSVPLAAAGPNVEALADDDLLYGEVGHASMDYLHERLGLAIGSSSRTIAATLIDAHHARVLESHAGAPALRVRRIVRDVHGRPIEYFDAIYCGELFEYSLEFDHT